MPIDLRAIREPRDDAINDPIRSRQVISRNIRNTTPDILQQNPQQPIGQRNRQMMMWRVPDQGIVSMYMNPQGISIQDKKIINKVRTKGGYVVQYWGEELTSIDIKGTTGSAGVEGINILEGVYRAEQLAFEKVATSLRDRLQKFSTAGSLTGLVGQGASRALGSLAGEAMKSVLGGAVNPPLLPTLGSLALSVEMFWQGWVYKGFFDSFSVDESVSNGVGVFNYTIKFFSFDKRGIRNNFMPWHRQPADLDPVSLKPLRFYKADANVVPPSFGGIE